MADSLPSFPTLPGTLKPEALLFPDMAQELALTRGMIARVPDGNNDWKPHDRSMTLGRLATHLSELPRFATLMLTTDEMDFAKVDWKPTVIDTTAARLVLFDELATGMRASVEGTDWATLSGSWTMRAGEQVYLTGQKATLLRTLGLSHMAHHRAQLGVWLRLLGVTIPGTYGPSADEM